MKPIISVKEARKILGKEAQMMTDEEVEKIISDLSFIARHAIRDFNEQKTTKTPQ